MAKTVGDLASIFQISPQTVRVWVKEFETYLSDGAKPDAGQARAFNEEDCRVLATVALMRAEQGTYKDIHTALDNGKRVDLPEDDTPPLEEPTGPVGAALVSQLRADVAKLEQKATDYEGTIRRLEADIDRERARAAEERQQAEEVRQKLLDAYERATRAETELGAYQRHHEAALEAERRAAKAESQLEFLREQQTPSAPQSALGRAADRWTVVEESKPKRKSWLDRILGR